MKISREFATILIKLLKREPVNYDRKTAISQLQNAIDLDILYAQSKPESRSVSQFRGPEKSVTRIKALSKQYINAEP